MHDGFVATTAIDTELLARKMYEVIGYRFELSGGVIALPPDLDFPNFDSDFSKDFISV